VSTAYDLHLETLRDSTGQPTEALKKRKVGGSTQGSVAFSVVKIETD
jgi:hypothetical protein